MQLYYLNLFVFNVRHIKIIYRCDSCKKWCNKMKIKTVLNVLLSPRFSVNTTGIQSTGVQLGSMKLGFHFSLQSHLVLLARKDSR